jgi:uncharacterized membrane protein YtjA (UPF0391 family)
VRGSPDFGSARSILFRRARANFRISRPGTIIPVSDWFSRRGASGVGANQIEGSDMLGWVVTFLIVALIAGILGFGGVAGASIEIAKIIFFIAVVLFLVSAVVGVARGRNRV